MVTDKDFTLGALEAHDEWALPIGRFMVAFSGCEAQTYMFIRVLGTPQQFKACRTLDLKKRLAIMGAAIDQVCANPDLQARCVKALKEMSELMAKRNLIAHNGPAVDAYFHKETGELHLEPSVRSQRDRAKVIRLDELGNLLIRVKSVKAELADLLYYLQFPENRKDRRER